jgi:hypothetical protein
VPRKLLASLPLAVLALAAFAAPAMAVAPTITSFTDPPTDDVVVDCGSYQIREVSTFSAKVIEYADGSRRVHATIDGSLYRSDQPGVVIGREHARTVRAIDGTLAKITGNRWHIVLYGSGMSVHDVGYIFWDFATGEVFAENGNHPVWNGEFDFSSLCAL